MLRTAVQTLLVLSACATTGVWLLAQQRPVFRADSHFVIVDAYPVRDGKVVPGLTAADFVVKEDGVVQTIDTFEFVEAMPAEPESARRDPNTIAESREVVANPRARAFVVALDLHHVSVAGSHRLRAPLVRMLNEMLTPSDLFGVISTEHDPATLTFARRITTTEDMLARYWSWGVRDSAVLHEDEIGLKMCFETEILPNGQIVDRMFEDGARLRKLPDVLIELYRESLVLDHLEDLVDVVGHMREGRTSVVLVTEGWRLSPPNTRLLAQVDRTQRNGPPGPGLAGGSCAWLTRSRRGFATRACCSAGASPPRITDRDCRRSSVAPMK